MTEDEALEEIERLVTIGSVFYTRHARQEMYEANANDADVENALLNTSDAKYQADRDRWKVTGRDLDGDDLDIVVEFQADLVIITVM